MGIIPRDIARRAKATVSRLLPGWKPAETEPSPADRPALPEAPERAAAAAEQRASETTSAERRRASVSGAEKPDSERTERSASAEAPGRSATAGEPVAPSGGPAESEVSARKESAPVAEKAAERAPAETPEPEPVAGKPSAPEASPASPAEPESAKTTAGTGAEKPSGEGAPKKADEPARKAPAKSTGTDSTTAKKSPAKAASAAKKSDGPVAPEPVKKATAAAQKTAGSAAPAKKAPAKTSGAAETPAKKTAAPVEKAPAKKAPAKKNAEKSAPAKKPPAKRPEQAPAVKLTARRMADPQYREDQYNARYEGPVAPINRLVDTLAEESGEWLPHLAPVYGGTEARLLTLFRDPGPKTQADKGSGMLSPENDDQSAERFLTFFDEAGLRANDLISWNTYPWYINRKPTTAEIDRGLDPLERLLALLPNLQVVMAHGVDAQNAWRRFEKKHPTVVRNLLVVPTYHTSKQALFAADPAVRAEREAKLRADFARVAEHLAE